MTRPTLFRWRITFASGRTRIVEAYTEDAARKRALYSESMGIVRKVIRIVSVEQLLPRPQAAQS